VHPDRLIGWVQDEGGWALVSVLWVLSILAMLGAATQLLTLTSARAERHTWERMRIQAILDAGVTRAIVGIADARIEKRWRVDGTPHPFDFEGARMSVSVKDELGRIDLNAADGSLLRQLLRTAGLSSGDVDRLADTILDWRTANAFSRLHGATDADYANAGLAWRPRHGPFQTVDELGLVLGMTPALLKRLRPALTVYSKHPSLDPGVAPREALLAYYPDQPERVDQILRDRSRAIPGGSAQTGPLTQGSSAGGRAFDITVELTEGAQQFRREAVVEFTGSDNTPPLVLAWR